MNEEKRLTEQQKRKIEQTLSKGDRVEIIPVKDGVKIMHIKRQEIKTE